MLAYGPGLGFRAFSGINDAKPWLKYQRPPTTNTTYFKRKIESVNWRPIPIGAEGPTGIVHEISLTEAVISITDSLARETARPLSEPSITISAEQLMRQIQRVLSEVSITIPAETLVKNIQKALSLSEPSISIPAETLSRAIARALSEPTISFSDAVQREAERVLNEFAISASDALAREVERSLSETPVLFSDSIIRMVSLSLSEPSLSFNDSIEIEVIPGGPPPPTGKRWRVHVWPVTPIHTPKVM